eukprot:9503546-Pyramimonas_sp.AAC.1
MKGVVRNFPPAPPSVDPQDHCQTPRQYRAADEDDVFPAVGEEVEEMAVTLDIGEELDHDQHPPSTDFQPTEAREPAEGSA